MLKLPDVTLVMIETRELKLAKMAIEDCLRVAEFGDVLILTNKPEEFSGLNCNPRFVLIEDWPDKVGWCRSSWFDVPPHVYTRQTLNIQWDSWIWDPAKWRDEFLEYDFIGAPWWYKDWKNVGNTGFCLKSKRLIQYIYDRRLQFPCDTSAEDDLLCRKYRPKLENAGFIWAPEKIAYDFAFECVQPAPGSRQFGFHAMFNWGRVLDHDRLLERARLALGSKYIQNSYIGETFCKMNPGIVKELLEEERIRSKEQTDGGNFSLSREGIP